MTGIRVTLPVETLDAKLASLPEGVSVSRDRIEVRFSGAKVAVERLYALAYALVNDYERFEALVDGGVGGGGRGVRMSEALVPAAAEPAVVTDSGADVVLPALIVDAGPAAVAHGSWSSSRDGSRTRGRGRRTGGPWGSFSRGARREASDLEAVSPLHVAAYIRTHPGSVPTVKQHLAAIRVLCDWLVVSQVLPVNPAAAVRGPKHVVTKGSTPVLMPAEARRLLDRDRRGYPSRAPGSGAPLGDALQLRAGERGPGDAEGRTTTGRGARGWLRLHEKGRAAA